MKLTSYGGATEVTGSKHLIDLNGARVLLDCGLFQGKRNEADRKNRRMGFEPEKVNAVVLSHAHIDHSGLLPMLVKQGFRGNVYATPATRDLCAIMLLDSAHIQQRDAEWLSKKNRTFVPPIYALENVREIMKRFVCVPYETSLSVAPGLTLTFHDAGHVLGSAMVNLEYSEGGQKRRLIFSGDIGRRNMPILNDPWEPTDADVVMMESTYGNRDHNPIEAADEKFKGIVLDTYRRGGKLVIPTFALERAQEVIFALKRLEMSNAIPDIPVYVDSPLTVNITEVFRLHTESFDREFSEVMQSAGDPFELRHIRYIRNLEDSMALNSLNGPAIILSASGMCEYGRILHHLRNHCEDPKNTILIVGFQAQNTLGRRIVERQRTIRIFGVDRQLNAQVRIMNEFSAHAGRSELLDFGGRFKGRAERILLVHGEAEALDSLKKGLEERGVGRVEIQRPNETIEI
jgi:metallo-beta-lactamase family protein